MELITWNPKDHFIDILTSRVMPSSQLTCGTIKQALILGFREQALWAVLPELTGSLSQVGLVILKYTCAELVVVKIKDQGNARQLMQQFEVCD